MKFYDVDNALQEAINAADKYVRLRIEIENGGHFECVFEQDIIEANFYSIKEVSGGVSSRGEVLIDNSCGFFSYSGGLGAGTQVKVSFSIGEGLAFFHRFNFYIDDKGIQEIRGNGRKKFVQLNLRDLSYKLRKSDEAKNWTSPVVFTYSVVCDKSQAEKSLVYGIAERAGLAVTDIDCSTIPVMLPYVRLRRNIWAELSNLAAAYRCHLECAVEKPLVFVNSPYQTEKLEMRNEECVDYSYLISGEDIFYLRKTARADYYRNSIRLKMNMPVSLEKQEIWRYGDAPVFYDEFYQAHYPFKYPLVREIENSKYEAKYRVIDAEGKERKVVFADEIDSKEEAENRLEYDTNEELRMKNEKCLLYSLYDTTSYFDMAVLTLKKEADVDLYRASIYGRPIVQDLNRSCFVRDDEQISKYGTSALNVTGYYFSDYKIDSIPHYEDWAKRELKKRVERAREFSVKTHKAIFNSRVGAKIKLKMKNEELKGTISALTLRYRKNEAFVASLKIIEEEKNEK